MSMYEIEAPCPKCHTAGVATMTEVRSNGGVVVRRDAKSFDCPSGCTFISPLELSPLKNYGL
jgi:hypothetical protein